MIAVYLFWPNFVSVGSRFFGFTVSDFSAMSIKLIVQLVLHVALQKTPPDLLCHLLYSVKTSFLSIQILLNNAP